MLAYLAVWIADGAETITGLRTMADHELLHGPLATALWVLKSADPAMLTALRAARAVAQERAWSARGQLIGVALPPARLVTARNW